MPVTPELPTSGPPQAPPLGASVVMPDNAIAYGCQQAGFAAASIPVMVAICLAESAGQCFAVSPAGDYGVAQINYTAHKDLFAAETGPLNWAFPQENLKMAASVFNAAGSFTPWTTYQNGSYAAYLARGRSAASAPDAAGYQQSIAAVGSEIAATALINTAQGLPAPPSGSTSPLVRVLEVIIGGGLLLLGLYKLTSPVTAPIVSASKKAASAAALA